MIRTSFSDFIPTNPVYSESEGFREIVEHKELLRLRSSAGETVSTPGDLFSFQKQFARIMLSVDRIINMQDAGTGKTCAFVAASEALKKTGDFRHTYIIGTGDNILNEIKKQIVHSCTEPSVYLNSLIKERYDEVLSPWYRFTTYEMFARRILGHEDHPITAPMSDELIREDYSKCVFIFDEAHNILDGERIREALWRLVTRAVEMKVMLITATPMRGSPNDLKPLLKILHGRDDEIMSRDFEKISYDELRPLIQGVCTYVRADQHNTSYSFAGYPMDVSYPKILLDGNEDGEIQSSTILLTSAMGSIQDQKYVALGGNPDFNSAEIQASVFVGKVNDVVIHRTLPCNMNRLPTDPFVFPRGELDSLRERGCKLAIFIESAFSSWGCVFGYFPLVERGVFLASELLERYGMGKYQSRIQGRKYAMITSTMSQKKVSEIKRAYNSPENADGSIIKVLLVSPVGKEGINVNHCLNAHIISPEWQPSDNYQVMSRVLRATGHNALREHMRRLGQSEDYVRQHIKVRFFRHAAVSSNGRSIDRHMYERSEDKAIKIGRVSKMLKQSAIDCSLNAERNREAISNPRPWTSDCDYQTCDYQCSIQNRGVIQEEYSVIGLIQRTLPLRDVTLDFLMGKGSGRTESLLAMEKFSGTKMRDSYGFWDVVVCEQGALRLPHRNQFIVNLPPTAPQVAEVPALLRMSQADPREAWRLFSLLEPHDKKIVVEEAIRSQNISPGVDAIISPLLDQDIFFRDGFVLSSFDSVISTTKHGALAVELGRTKLRILIDGIWRGLTQEESRDNAGIGMIGEASFNEFISGRTLEKVLIRSCDGLLRYINMSEGGGSTGSRGRVVDSGNYLTVMGLECGTYEAIVDEFESKNLIFNTRTYRFS